MLELGWGVPQRSSAGCICTSESSRVGDDSYSPLRPARQNS